MLDDILGFANEFVEKLKNDEIFIEYLKAKNDVSQDDVVKAKVLAYKKGHLEYQLNKINGSQMSQEYERTKNDTYWELMLNDKSRRFIEYENLLINKVNKVFNIISDACEIDQF